MNGSREEAISSQEIPKEERPVTQPAITKTETPNSIEGTKPEYNSQNPSDIINTVTPAPDNDVHLSIQYQQVNGSREEAISSQEIPKKKHLHIGDMIKRMI